MPGESFANLADLGGYAKERIQLFAERTGRELIMEVEPGTYVVANAASLIATVIDKKQTGPDGFQFIVLDGGMEVNARPLMYGARHPFSVVSRDGELLSVHAESLVVAGRCCESGDSQSLDERGRIVPRTMAEPQIGDFVVIGGCGAYCSSMAPFNYNSHVQAPEALLRANRTLKLIRRPQTLEQITGNEFGLEDTE